MGFFGKLFRSVLKHSLFGFATDTAKMLLYGASINVLVETAEAEMLFPLGGAIRGRRHFLVPTMSPFPPDDYKRSTLIHKQPLALGSDPELWIYIWFNSVPKSRWSRLKQAGQVVDL